MLTSKVTHVVLLLLLVICCAAACHGAGTIPGKAWQKAEVSRRSCAQVSTAFLRWSAAMRDARRSGLSSCYAPDAVVVEADGKRSPAGKIRRQYFTTADGLVHCRVGLPSVAVTGKDVIVTCSLDEKTYHGCLVATYRTWCGKTALRYRFHKDRWLIVEERLDGQASVDRGRY